MTKKGNLIYKIVSGLTLALPLPIYLFLSATLFNIVPDVTIYTTIENVEVIELEETYFITVLDNAAMNGHVEYVDGKYGITIEESTIIKIDKQYYSYVEKDEVRQLVDIKKFEMQKEQSYKIPMAFFISLFGVLIVAMIISGKMNWQKKHPRIAVMIALLTGTVVLFIIDTIVGGLLNVFIVATASWAIYCMEYMIVQGKINQQDAEKKESDILTALKAALKDG